MLLFLLLLVTPGLFSGVSRAASLVRLQDAMDLPEPPSIQSDYAILIEMKSGAILYEKNALEKAYPASITKIMTALLTAEHCEMGESVTFSYRATHELQPGGSSIARTEDEVMTVEECLYGLLVASANEVAQALAEHVSGSLESFASLMTLRAYELGAVNTNFANSHGMHEENHYTCAYDMALIAREAFKHDKLVTIMGTEKYQIPPTNKHDEITYLQMRHPLLTKSADMKYPFALAGKTGYTEEALNTLVTYARQGDLDLIAVVMHGNGIPATGSDSIALFNYGFQNYRCLSLSSAESVLQEGSSAFLSGNLLQLVNLEEDYCTLPRGMGLSDLYSQVVLGNEPEAGELASRIYYIGGQEVARCRLTVAPAKEGIRLTPVARVAPTQKEILRQVHLGLPLIYWILIGGGVLLLILLLLAVWLIRRLLRSRQRRKEHAKRALSRIAE